MAGPNPWNLQMFPFLEKRPLQMLLNQGLQMGRLSWIFQVGPTCNHTWRHKPENASSPETRRDKGWILP